MGIIRTCTECGSVFAGSECPSCPESSQIVSDSPPPFDMGQEFQGLEILSELGRGGMGIVYKARQINLDRLVAVKMIPANRTHSRDLEIRFEREAKALASLSHPNIVPVHDFGFGEDVYYFTMDCIEGRSLRDLIQNDRPAMERSIDIIAEICDALEYAHSKSIIHRDIKPENILLDERGHVRVADFGLAKIGGRHLDSLTVTQSGAALGTTSYMAPEQQEDSATVDHRADIYATGVILYELLTGDRPMGQFKPPSKRAPVDPRLDEIVSRTLARDRDERFASAAELRKALRDLNSDQKVATDLNRKGKRSPMRWMALPLAFLLLVGAFLTWRHLKERDTANTNTARTGPPYPKGLPLSVDTAYSGHNDSVDTLSISRNGRTLASGSSDGTVRLWDLSTGKPMHTLTGFQSGVRAVAFDGKDEMLYTGSGKGPIRMWSVSGGFEIQLYLQDDKRYAKMDAHNNWVNSLAYNSGAQILASAGDDRFIVLWKSTQIFRKLQGHTFGINAAAFSPDGTLLASGSNDSTVRLWDPGSGKEIRAMVGHKDGLNAIAFHPSGKYLASGGLDKTIRIWNVSTGRLRYVIEEPKSIITSLAYRPDGKIFAAGGLDGTIRIWSSEEGKLLQQVEANLGGVHSIAFHPDGRRLFSGGKDSMIRVWKSKK